ncbi:MAG: hypothetical protein QNJ44_04900 [Rhodobacter sp.]|nr:hypothetical protein [Rhodobacter sp.]
MPDHGEVADLDCREDVGNLAREDRNLFAQVELTDGLYPDPRGAKIESLADFPKRDVPAERHDRVEELDVDPGEFSGTGAHFSASMRAWRSRKTRTSTEEGSIGSSRPISSASSMRSL